MATKLKNLFLTELSFVDHPANDQARVSIFKRDMTKDLPPWLKDKKPKDGEEKKPTEGDGKTLPTDEKVPPPEKDGETDDAQKDPKKKVPPNFETFAKAMYASVAPYGGFSSAEDDPSKPKSFEELLAQNEEYRRESKVSDEFWPLFDALRESVMQIVADRVADSNTKIAAIRHSVEQFMARASTKVPDAMTELAKLLKRTPAAAEVFKAGQPGDECDEHEQKDDMAMSDSDKKEIETLKGQVSELTTKLAAATSKITEVEKASGEATQKLAEATKTIETMKSAAEIAKTDEVIKVKDGDKDIEVRKSEVGAGTWAMLKSQQAAIDKAQNDAEIAKAAKRGETEFGNLPGESVVKGTALKALESLTKENREAIEVMLKAGNAALKGGFRESGHAGTTASADGPAAQLEKMADEYAAKQNVSKSVAYDIILKTADGKRLYRESLTEAA